MNFYFCVFYGKNMYYKIEVFFKVFGCVFCEVIMINLEIKGVNLIKGVL